MISDDIELTRHDGAVTIDRPTRSRWTVVSRDWRVMAAMFGAATLGSLGFSTLVGGWDQYFSWAYHLALALMIALYVALLHIERRRLGWVIFLDDSVIRIAHDRAWNWVSDNLERNEQMKIWVARSVLGGRLHVGNGDKHGIFLDSDLTWDELLDLGQFLAEHMSLSPDEPSSERLRTWS